MERPNIDQRARAVRRVLVIEGLCNLALALTELSVGLMTGSWVLVADAMHSATDLANNVVAWFAMRVAGAPADDDHPYGHGKFEILAVFGLATLMGVLALEILLGVLRGGAAEPVTTGPLSLAVACGVMVLQLGLAYWQNRQARRLESELLHADATHTLADTATTLAAIVGWQIAARGFPWLDRVLAVAVAVFVLALAFQLFRRAIPILVDGAAVPPNDLVAVLRTVEGVAGVGQVRSRWDGTRRTADVTVRVDPTLDAVQAHDIADEVEASLTIQLAFDEVLVHVEPDIGGGPPGEGQ